MRTEPPFEINRGIVRAVDTTSGESQVEFPGYLNAGGLVTVGNAGLSQTVPGTWDMPALGSHVFLASDPRDRAFYVGNPGAQAAASAGMNVHLADPDPHPQYLTTAEANIVYSRQTSGSGSPAGTGIAGDRYYDSTNKRLFLSDGGGWIIMQEPPNTTTPTLSGLACGTGGSALNRMIYQRSGGFLDFEWRFVFGTSGQTFPASPVVTVPVAFAESESVFPCILLDASVTRYYGVLATQSSTTLALLQWPATATGGAFVTAAAMGTWTPGAGDVFICRGRYRMTTQYS